MKIKILTIGKTKEKWLQKGIATYLNRLPHYSTVNYKEYKSLKGQGNKQLLLREEAKWFLQQIENRDFVILLDEAGAQWSSIHFATKLSTWQNQSITNLTFCIGGAYGFHSTIYDRANKQLSLSKMTFTHQMVRLIFVEQLYRAFTIIRGEKYHHV